MVLRSPKPLVLLDKVEKRYGSFNLKIESLTINEDEFFVIIGPSGSGKSTLLRLIGGFTAPDRGRVLVSEQPAMQQVGEQRIIRTLFQDLALFPHLNVVKQLRLAAISGQAFRQAQPESSEDVVEQWVERLQLGDRRFNRPSELSGGERQRLALGRAMISQPRLLLLDEPMTALDHGLRFDLWRYIDSLADATETAFVVVTHDPDIALSRGQRIAVIEEGRCVQVGTPSDLYRQPATQSVARLLGSANVVHFSNRQLVIRPEQIKIDLKPILDKDFSDEATLIHSAYFGSTIEYTLAWNNERLLVRSLADEDQYLPLKRTVYFGWDQEDASFLN